MQERLEIMLNLKGDWKIIETIMDMEMGMG